jgi:RNA polymerase sigma-70 factor (ECF subfamily)
VPPWSDLPADLVQRACRGDAAALQEMLQAHLPELNVFVRLNMGEHLRARESVSDVTQSLVGDLLPLLATERFADLGGFRAWLRRAALNKIVDKHRFHTAQQRGGERRAEVTPSVAEELDLLRCLRALPTPSQAAIDEERAERLERALQRLPEDQRQVVSMKQLCGLSHQEIAAVLGRSEPACRMLLRRGMVRLARELELLGGGG